MSENVLGFIKWAAGIVITLAIISIAFIIFNTSKGAAMQGVKKISEMNNQIGESDIIIYDDLEVTGSEVVNVIKKFNGDFIGIQVKTGKNPSGTWYGYNVSISTNEATIGSANSNEIVEAIDESSTKYINPNGSFMGKIYRDVNGTIVAVVFTQE